ncbi:unnamed protein product [Didymodactylos carnosus]|uniref:Fungal lipase-type domain-containing protein n=1 Tax=Didymodactylos carnosus TaxID=1234261 RepID=A0A815IEK9_9BILA|nr:unnamed protein product [Didymodactylos carnosus]CAF4246322.1 unnamed protein product [Didymodactylos carnosus]
MSESRTVVNEEEILFPDIPPLNVSTSVHSTVQGKIWVRLLINLCWWLHDMREVDGNDPNSKFKYIESKLAECKMLFPGRFTLMFSDPGLLSEKQHPFLICRQDEHKVIILVFHATVSSKSIQDVFTDASLYSDRNVYGGDRHSGFSERAESGPLLAVINWLNEGWKVIVGGHSLGGAVSQLFTVKVIQNLVEFGSSLDKVWLRCITFGTPQCADRHF